MIKYSVIKNGIETNGWNSDFADETHWEPGFGLPSRPELDSDGNPTGNTLPAEYEIIQEDITAQLAQAKTNQEALDYLASTDWMIIRAMDTETPIPEDVKAKRQIARLSIVK
jgi:hypothetical protein